MTAKDFIIIHLRNLLKEFPLYSFKLWSDLINSNHFIEVIPSSFEGNSDFIEEEFNFIDRFSEQYLNDGIAFITSEDKLTLNSLSFVEEVCIIPSWFNIVESTGYKAILKGHDCKKAESAENEYNYALAA